MGATRPHRIIRDRALGSYQTQEDCSATCLMEGLLLQSPLKTVATNTLQYMSDPHTNLQPLLRLTHQLCPLALEYPYNTNRVVLYLTVRNIQYVYVCGISASPLYHYGILCLSLCLFTLNVYFYVLVFVGVWVRECVSSYQSRSLIGLCLYILYNYT